MKKSALLLAVLLIAVLLFACKEPAQTADTVPPTDTAEATAEETAEETQAETEAATQDESRRLYDLLTGALNKTVNLYDIEANTTRVIELRVNAAGFVKDFKQTLATAAKVKDNYRAAKTVEIHQTSENEYDGKTETELTDLYMNKTEIFKKLPSDTRFSVIGWSGEGTSLYRYYYEANWVEIVVDHTPEDMKNAGYTDNADGSVTVIFTPEEDSAKVYVRRQTSSLKDMLASIGAEDVEMTVKSINAEYTVSADGYIVSCVTEISYDVTAKIDGAEMAVSGTAREETAYKDPGASVEIVFPERPAEPFELYNPFYGEYDYTSEIVLEPDGTYEIHSTIVQPQYGMTVITVESKYGNYVYNEDKTRVTCDEKNIVLRLLFSGEEDRATFKTFLDTALKSKALDETLYNMMIKAMDEEGYSASGDDLEKIKSAFENMGSQRRFHEGDIMLDAESKKAYVTVADILLKENEYYIAYEDIYLKLEDDGTCSMYGEYTASTEGFGEFTESYIYKGKYEKNELSVVCTFTSYNEKLSFSSSEALKEYKRMYKEQYDSGYLGKFYYDYYMALVSTEGYTEDGEDVYKILLEPHTHTASITEAPDYES